MLKKLLLMTNGEIQVGHITIKVGKHSISVSGSTITYYGYGSDYEGSEIVRNSSGVDFIELGSSILANSQEPKFLVAYRTDKKIYRATCLLGTRGSQTSISIYNSYDSKEDTFFNESDYGKSIDIIICTKQIAPNYKVTVGKRVAGNETFYGYYSGVSGTIEPATIQCSTFLLNIGQVDSTMFWGDPVNKFGFSNPQGSENISVARFNVQSLISLSSKEINPSDEGSTGIKEQLPVFTSSDLNKVVPLYLYSDYTLKLEAEKVLSQIALN